MGVESMKRRARVRRFRNVINFNTVFITDKGKALQQSEELQRRKEWNERKKRTDDAEAVQMNDKDIAYFNLIFKMKVETQFQFEHGFPLMVLFMMDAIYPKKVPWHKVAWRFNYKYAADKNYEILEQAWNSVEMEKTPHFNPTKTHHRIENMREAILPEKLSFLRTMRAWFDARIYWAPKYNPMERRYALVAECAVKGYQIKYPAWIPFDAVECARHEQRSLKKRQTENWENIPEFRRFMYFMGTPECQEM